MSAATDASPDLQLTPLPYATPRRWAAAQLAHRAELLVEQAHLEKKAAAAAVAFLFRAAVPASLQRRLAALAREELLHFERTLRLCAEREVAFGPQPPSGYAEQLKRAVRSTMPERLVDELLVAALIEARSHERLQLLAAAHAEAAGGDADLAAFYLDLAAAEERHAPLYAEVAAALVGAPAVVQRWGELAAHEAAVLAAAPFAPRLHSGAPDGV